MNTLTEIKSGLAKNPEQIQTLMNSFISLCAETLESELKSNTEYNQVFQALLEAFLKNEKDKNSLTRKNHVATAEHIIAQKKTLESCFMLLQKIIIKAAFPLTPTSEVTLHNHRLKNLEQLFRKINICHTLTSTQDMDLDAIYSFISHILQDNIGDKESVAYTCDSFNQYLVKNKLFGLARKLIAQAKKYRLDDKIINAIVVHFHTHYANQLPMKLTPNASVSSSESISYIHEILQITIIAIKDCRSNAKRLFQICSDYLSKILNSSLPIEHQLYITQLTTSHPHQPTPEALDLLFLIFKAWVLNILKTIPAAALKASKITADEIGATRDFSSIHTKIASLSRSLSSPHREQCTAVKTVLDEKKLAGITLTPQTITITEQKSIRSLAEIKRVLQENTGRFLSLIESFNIICSENMESASIDPKYEETYTLLLNEILKQRKEISTLTLSFQEIPKQLISTAASSCENQKSKAIVSFTACAAFLAIQKRMAIEVCLKNFQEIAVQAGLEICHDAMLALYNIRLENLSSLERISNIHYFTLYLDTEITQLSLTCALHDGNLIGRNATQQCNTVTENLTESLEKIKVELEQNPDQVLSLVASFNSLCRDETNTEVLHQLLDKISKHPEIIESENLSNIEICLHLSALHTKLTFSHRDPTKAALQSLLDKTPQHADVVESANLSCTEIDSQVKHLQMQTQLTLDPGIPASGSIASISTFSNILRRQTIELRFKILQEIAAQATTPEALSTLYRLRLTNLAQLLPLLADRHDILNCYDIYAAYNIITKALEEITDDKQALINAFNALTQLLLRNKKMFPLAKRLIEKARAYGLDKEATAAALVNYYRPSSYRFLTTTIDGRDSHSVTKAIDYCREILQITIKTITDNPQTPHATFYLQTCSSCFHKISTTTFVGTSSPYPATIDQLKQAITSKTQPASKDDLITECADIVIRELSLAIFKAWITNILPLGDNNLAEIENAQTLNALEIQLKKSIGQYALSVNENDIFGKLNAITYALHDNRLLDNNLATPANNKLPTKSGQSSRRNKNAFWGSATPEGEDADIELKALQK